MTTEAYEKRGELIRAPIRTRLGNVVMRWVKPDNPNIVVERRPAEAVPEPEPATEKFPDLYEIGAGVCGCCGATYLRAAPKVEPKEWTPEEIKAAWEKAWGPSYRMYIGYVERYKARPRDAEYYAQSAKNYGLERYTEIKQYLKNNNTYTQAKPGDGNGVTISPDPFEGYTLKTPAGWYLRCDRAPVNNKTDDHFEPETLSFPSGAGAKRYLYAGATMPFPDDNMSWCLSGMLEGQYSGYNMMAACKQADVPVGAKVIAIFNQGQHNSNGKVTPRAVADAGFRLVMKTGNHNHPDRSTLYVYERVIQKGDYDEIK